MKVALGAHFEADFVELLAVLVLEVLADELGPLELLAAEGAEPLVLRQLLRVRRYERLHLPATQTSTIKRLSESFDTTHTH